jgi:hypothetical protein
VTVSAGFRTSGLTSMSSSNCRQRLSANSAVVSRAWPHGWPRVKAARRASHPTAQVLEGMGDKQARVVQRRSISRDLRLRNRCISAASPLL